MLDAPGVLAKVSGLFSKGDISISEVKQVADNNGQAEIVVITHLASESSVKKTAEKLSALAEVSKVNSIIRIED